MKRITLAASVVFGLCLLCADVHSQAEQERGKTGSDKRGGKLTRKTEAGLVKSCKDDIDRFCKGVEQGPKLGKCLLENESELAADCLKALKSLPSSGQKGKTGKGGAGNQETEAALNKDCREDISRFCKGIEPGPQQGQCLMENESKLSAGCGKTLKSLPPPDQEGGPGKEGSSGNQKTGAALMKACKADLTRFCKGIAQGPKQGQCLMKNQSRLSAECGKTLESLPPPDQQEGGAGEEGSGNQKAIAALNKSCKDDTDTFCKGIEPGPKLGQCLMENESKLSSECEKTLKSLPPPDQQGGAALMKACKADIGRFCNGIGPGPKQGQCLMENESKLSAECGKTLKSLPPPEERGGSGRGGPGGRGGE
ncbi:MAG: hypothetical protein HY796_13575 [Elusimicrobia bacterium]|nr:hypothetical protein [Elusimicrobiota bacterium]